MKEFTADLHIHSCLSPCADLYMTPARIAGRARDAGLDMIAICDHNSAENVPYAARACSTPEGPDFIPGIEISSAEEVHVIGLFGNVERALRMQRIVYDHLPPEPSDSSLYGDQVVVNENDEVEGFNGRLLIGSVSLDLRRVVDEIHGLGGIAIAAHIDREAFGVIGQLGYIPEDVDFDAVELSPSSRTERYLGSRVFPVLRSSDAHSLDEVGGARTSFLLEKPGFGELRMALHAEGGRKVVSPGDLEPGKGRGDISPG
jgi:PHP family Zn ribbon phosphoesterase